MFLMTEAVNSSTAAKEPNDAEKVKAQTVAGESTIRLLKPSGMADVSTFDSVELRNYIYGVNGRY